MVTSGSSLRACSRCEVRFQGHDESPRRRPLKSDFTSTVGGSVNDLEVTMNNALPKSNLIATEKAIDAAAAAIALVKRVPAPLRAIADQVVRSASSVAANLAERHRRFGRDRIHHWRIAYASAKEVDCHLRLLAHACAVDRSQAGNAIGLFDEVRALTWRLLYPTS